MSDSKYRYYEVTTTQVVRALNQADAITVATTKRPAAILGSVLSTETDVTRIPATEAHTRTLNA